MIDINDLDVMSEHEERAFWVCVLRSFSRDDGEAAQAHLLAGQPIYYCEDAFGDTIVREWPNGSKELVSIDDQGAVAVVACLV